ncbi:hypothetical protein CRUP_018885 [Coryphaenoides rupestris]|nr:hypothetical protein CRUP_018885 [Coryphaenoides rupestris]
MLIPRGVIVTVVIYLRNEAETSDLTSTCAASSLGLGWAGLGWAGLGWSGLGWAGLVCAGLARPGPGLPRVGMRRVYTGVEFERERLFEEQQSEETVEF